MQTLQEINEETILEDLRELIARFEVSLPTRVDPAGLTLKSKIPFKVLSLREVLFHRTTTLARAALDLYDENKRVPSYILMRSTVETCAACYALRKKISTFLEESNVDEFDDFLVKGLSGGRDDKAKHRSLNVLTLVNHVDREYDGFRRMYDVLCEYAHPNYLGTLDAFGKVDRDNVWLDLGPELRMPPPAFGLALFFFSLEVFEEQYNIISDDIRKIDEYFEQDAT